LADTGCSEVAVSEGDDGAGAVVVTGGGQAWVDHLTQLPNVVGPTPENTRHCGVSCPLLDFQTLINISPLYHTNNLMYLKS